MVKKLVIEIKGKELDVDLKKVGFIGMLFENNGNTLNTTGVIAIEKKHHIDLETALNAIVDFLNAVQLGCGNPTEQEKRVKEAYGDKCKHFENAFTQKKKGMN